ncbi:MAG: NAD(P)/FAD-dependent oxidoreductase [Phycisphaerae bacterium]|nr:NAD(P)/FAD-dependent oxidoreductase [Phycisphaerae bacterium]
MNPWPHVVIVGGGFAGLNAARALRRAAVRITLVDRRNHHLFQPMLYQVATAALSPAHIAAPIRQVISSQRNASVVLAQAERVDAAASVLHLDSGPVAYDYLMLATGATHSYFGHDDWSAGAPGLKTVEDALHIRSRFLMAFERAESEPDPGRREALMTFVVIGAGPTGVEMAGAIAEIARTVIGRDFRNIDTRRARVVLVEARDRVLPVGYPTALCARARRDLERMGVDVRLSCRVTGVERSAERSGVRLGDVFLPAHNVIWAAGVRGSSLGATLGTPLDEHGRVIVAGDLSIPGFPNVFVCGDLAHAVRGDSARPDELVPGVCPAAVQMGRFAAAIIAREAAALQSGRPAPKRPAFAYVDKGSLATIGRARAVASIGRWNFAGLPAWLLWAGVHVFFLIGFRNRVLVMLEWAWAYVFFKRGARLITGEPEALRGAARHGDPTPGRPPISGDS